MKKIKGAFLFAVACSFLFISCNSGLSGPDYTIKMRMNKADTFHQNMKVNMQMNMAIPGQPMNMKMLMDMGLKFEVMSNSNENKELKFTYNSMHMSMDMGNKISSAVNTDSIMDASSQRVVGKSIFLELSPTNEITAVKGFDSLMQNNDADEASRQLIEKMFSKDQMNNLFGMMFSMYPNKPVKIGESWNASTKVNIANIDMRIKIKYTLAGVKNGLADIDIDGVIDGKGEMKQQGMTIGIDMSGSQKGTLTIKMDDGYLQNGSYKMNVKADMEMMGQKIPMTIKADYFLNNK
jgi:hypothetical protein